MAISGKDPAQLAARVGIARLGTARLAATSPTGWLKSMVAAVGSWVLVRKA